MFSTSTFLLLLQQIRGGGGRGGGSHASDHADAVFWQGWEPQLTPLLDLNVQQLLKATQSKLHKETTLSAIR